MALPPPPSHLPSSITEPFLDPALAQISMLVAPTPSMPPVPSSPIPRPHHPPPSPTHAQSLPHSSTPRPPLPAQSPSLLLPPSVDTGPRDDSADVSRALLNWHAARESVINQMVTMPDIVAPPTAPSSAKAKTGGRRGRGGRRSTTKSQGQLRGSPSTPLLAGESSGRGKGRGRGRGSGRARGSASGLKRKRGGSEDEVKAPKDVSDSSETFTPLPTQSRSGRRIFQASAFTPAELDLEDGTEFKTFAADEASGTPLSRGKRGRKGYRKAGDASVCKNCGRGHSPTSNMIVFCDGCNTPWHQYCHDKPISHDVVTIEEKEWYCADCDVLQEEHVQLKDTVSAEGMSLAEKRRYLQTLPASHLISLLLHATSLNPTLPIFPATISLSLSLSGTHPPSAAAAAAPAVPEEEEEEPYDLLYPSSGTLPYPKAGNGVPLPREQDDLAFLVDDDTVTFSHRWEWDVVSLRGGWNGNGNGNERGDGGIGGGGSGGGGGLGWGTDHSIGVGA